MSIGCAQCGVVFSMPEQLEEKRRADHGEFYCPNGHSNYFPGKTKQEKEIERLERAAHDWREWAGQHAAERDAWTRALRHCPICERLVSKARTPERAAERLRFHLVEGHGARPLRLAITARAGA